MSRTTSHMSHEFSWHHDIFNMRKAAEVALQKCGETPKSCAFRTHRSENHADFHHHLSRRPAKFSQVCDSGPDGTSFKTKKNLQTCSLSPLSSKNQKKSDRNWRNATCKISTSTSKCNCGKTHIVKIKQTTSCLLAHLRTLSTSPCHDVSVFFQTFQANLGLILTFCLCLQALCLAITDHNLQIARGWRDSDGECYISIMKMMYKNMFFVKNINNMCLNIVS